MKIYGEKNSEWSRWITEPIRKKPRGNLPIKGRPRVEVGKEKNTRYRFYKEGGKKGAGTALRARGGNLNNKKVFVKELTEKTGKHGETSQARQKNLLKSNRKSSNGSVKEKFYKKKGASEERKGQQDKKKKTKNNHCTKQDRTSKKS